MKLPVKVAGVCGSGTFLLIILVSFVQYLQPAAGGVPGLEAPPWTDLFNILTMALAGMAVATVLGYLMGDILSKPEGQRTPRKTEQAAGSGQEQPAPAPPLADAQAMPAEGAAGEIPPLETARTEES